jgi:hypothetical protein
MARKLLEAADSKRARQQEEGVEVQRVFPRRKAEKLPNSFRLGAVEIARLHRLSARLGEAAGRPIAETEAIKGLLLRGEHTDRKKLLGCVQDAVFESKYALRL